MSQATQADGNEHLRLEASNAERSATLVLDRKDGGWVIISATFYRRDDEFSCRIEGGEDGGFSEHVSDNQEEVKTGRRDTIAPFWWETGLMRMCFN